MRLRQLDPHIGAAAVLAPARGGPPTMRARYCVDDRQAEASAASRARPVAAREALECVPVQAPGRTRGRGRARAAARRRPMARRRARPDPLRGEARCPRGSRAPAPRAGDPRAAPGRRPERPAALGPASAARDSKRRAVDSRSSAVSSRSGRTGSLPSSARASTSRSSASCTSRSLSPAADATASRSSSAVRPSRRASSSSALSSASGVRSSWLALATKPRSRSADLSSRSSISLSVPPSFASSSPAGGTGRRRAAAQARDLRGLVAHRAHGPQRGGGQPVAGQRGEQQGDRPAGEQDRSQRRQRLFAVLAGGANHDHSAVRGPGEQAHALVEPGHGVAVHEQRAAAWRARARPP